MRINASACQYLSQHSSDGYFKTLCSWLRNQHCKFDTCLGVQSKAIRCRNNRPWASDIVRILHPASSTTRDLLQWGPAPPGKMAKRRFHQHQAGAQWNTWPPILLWQWATTEMDLWRRLMGLWILVWFISWKFNGIKISLRLDIYKMRCSRSVEIYFVYSRYWSWADMAVKIHSIDPVHHVVELEHATRYGLREGGLQKKETK